MDNNINTVDNFTLSKLEKIIAERYLVPKLKNPSKDILQQVSTVLEQQFEPSYVGEVGGSMFYKPTDLEFLIVKYKSLSLLEKQLSDFECGKPVDLSELVSLAGELVEIRKRVQMNDRATPMIYSLYVMFDTFIYEPGVVNKYSKEDKTALAHLYQKYIIDPQYRFTISDLKVPGKDLVGMFHVHNDSSEPSSQDLKINREWSLPSVVISAEKDYLESGVKLYLIYSGVSHLVYNGPIEIKLAK